MPYCPKCGVELETSQASCPLCKSPAAASPGGAGEPSYPESTGEPESVERLTPGERKKIAIEVLSVSLGIALVIPLLINLAVNRRIDWSLYPAVSLVFVWTVVFAAIRFDTKPWIAFSIVGPGLVAFLLCLDIFDGSLDWFPPLGLPLSLLFEGIAAATAVLASLLKRKGMNLVGLILLGLDCLCLGIDAVLTHWLNGNLAIGWSLVVTIAAVPISGFLFYLHYRIIRQASLRKLFRL
jgi:hypothetical protein